MKIKIEFDGYTYISEVFEKSGKPSTKNLRRQLINAADSAYDEHIRHLDAKKYPIKPRCPMCSETMTLLREDKGKKYIYCGECEYNF